MSVRQGQKRPRSVDLQDIFPSKRARLDNAHGSVQPLKLEPPAPRSASVEQLLAAQKALDLSAIPSTILCRTALHTKINEFIDSAIKARQGNSLYVCGSPGTGKTASLNMIRREVNVRHGVSVVCMNAMRDSKSPLAFFPGLLFELTKRSSALSRSSVDAANDIQNLLVGDSKTGSKGTCGKMTVVIVDEIDGLMTRDQSILDRLFGWAKVRGSFMVLIGISNSIDLPSKFLARSASRPQALVFPPYTYEELVIIVCQRLRDAAAATATASTTSDSDAAHGKSTAALPAAPAVAVAAKVAVTAEDIALELNAGSAFGSGSGSGSGSSSGSDDAEDDDAFERRLLEREQQQAEPRSEVKAHAAPASAAALSPAVADPELAGKAQQALQTAVPFFARDAVELCARKIAALSGDARRCLDICGACLKQLQALHSNPAAAAAAAAAGAAGSGAGAAAAGKSGAGACPSPPLVVDFARMVATLRSMLSPSSVTVIQKLPLHTKVVLAVAAIVFHHNKLEATTRKFSALYKSLCRQMTLPPIKDEGDGSFLDLINQLVDGNLMSIQGARLGLTGRAALGTAGGGTRGGGTSGGGKHALDRSITLNVSLADVQYAVATHSQRALFEGIFRAGQQLQGKGRLQMQPAATAAGTGAGAGAGAGSN